MDCPIPNNDTPGSRANNGYLPLSREADPVHPSNTTADRRNGTMPLSGVMGAIQPPNHKFAVGLSGPATAAAMQGGAVPVEPGHGGPVGGGTAFDQARADSAGTLRMPRR